MDLHDAATYFDDDPVYDGYTGALLFYGQSTSFDASKSDGSSFRRRALSVAPGTSLPARQVLSLYGDRWVAGYGTPDGFGGEQIRLGFNLKHATDNLAILTPAEALAAAAGTSVWVQKLYLREETNAQTDSDFDPQWNIFVAPGEPVVKGTFFRDGSGKLYRTREEYQSIEGLRVAISDQLDDGLLSATFQGDTYDPVQDKHSGASATVPAIKLDISKLYRLRERSDGTIAPGDIAALVPTSAGAKTGSRFTLAGRDWIVRSAQTELDATLLHARGAA
jgi:hypothetical protein